MVVMACEPQRMVALKHGNHVRFNRAQFKRDLHDGTVRIGDVLATPPEFLCSMPVWELLVAVPRIGPVGVNRVLRRADVWPLRPCGALTRRQLGRLWVEVQAATGRGVRA